MRQAIHIFKKDVRHLWIEIAVALLAAGLFAFVHTNPAFWQSKARLPQTAASFFVSFLLPISWLVLIVRAIHGEPLTGDREFWQTRPYSWKSLLAAKATLMLLFVNVPMLFAQGTILQAHGFQLGAEFPALLWNQVLLTVASLLPVAALGALTSGMGQVLVVGLVSYAGLLLLSFRLGPVAAALAGSGWGPMEWIDTYYALLLAALAISAIVIWQYAQRRTMAARIAAAGVVVVLALGTPISWTQAFAIQSHFSRRPVADSSIRAGLNTSFQWMTRAAVQSGRGVTLSIPLQVTGMPDDVVAKPEGITGTIEGPGGAVWRIEGPAQRNVTSTGQLITLRTTVDETFYRRIKDKPVAVRGYLFATLYGNRHETKVPFTGQRRRVPGMGMCTATGGPPATYFLSCYSALRPRADRVALTFEPHPRVLADYSWRAAPSYSPFPAELSIDPLSRSEAYSTYQGPLDAVTVSSEEPVAFVRAPLEIEALHLGAYEAKLK